MSITEWKDLLCIVFAAMGLSGAILWPLFGEMAINSIGGNRYIALNARVGLAVNSFFIVIGIAVPWHLA